MVGNPVLSCSRSADGAASQPGPRPTGHATGQARSGKQPNNGPSGTVSTVPDLADHAYAHCVAVLIGTGASRRPCAAQALRRGRQGPLRRCSPSPAQLALEETAEPPIPDFEPGRPDRAGLGTGEHPIAVVVRAVVDLQLRHDLDRAGLARTLGLARPRPPPSPPSSPTTGAGSSIPPFSPGSAPGTATSCGPSSSPTASGWRPRASDDDAGGRPGAGPHHRPTARRGRGRQRPRRAVRGLHRPAPSHGVGPLPRRASGRWRRRRRRCGPRPAAAPSGSGPCPDRRPPRRRGGPGRAPAPAVEADDQAGDRWSAAWRPPGWPPSAITQAASQPSTQDRRNDRVAALTKVAPAGGALTLTPPEVRPSAGRHAAAQHLRARSVRWNGERREWRGSRSSPRGGRAPARRRRRDRHPASWHSAPEGDQRIPVTVQGDDGSTAGALVDSSVEHPPTLAASVDACAVQATAVDEGGCALGRSCTGAPPPAASGPRRSRWRAPGPAGTYCRTLPAGDGPTSWWVTAVDGRGNRGQTDGDHPRLPSSC